MKTLVQLLKGMFMLLIQVLVLAIYATAKLSESLSKVVAESAQSHLKDK